MQRVTSRAAVTRYPHTGKTLLMQLSADLQSVLNSTEEIKPPGWPSAHIYRGNHEVGSPQAHQIGL